MERIEITDGVQRRRLQKRPEHLYTGKEISLRSNLRWATDSFEIPCQNGDVVRLIFVIDTCDQEIIAWVAKKGEVKSKAVRDLILQAVKRRFAAPRTPGDVALLTSYGRCYTVKETVAYAQSLGLVPCFKAADSSDSSGTAESFIKAFNRDYVYAHDRANATTVLAQLECWFDDYNESCPPRD